MDVEVSDEVHGVILAWRYVDIGEFSGRVSVDKNPRKEALVKEAERRRSIPKAKKLIFMECRDAVLAGPADKDRRDGQEMRRLKVHIQGLNLGEHVALEKLHDRFNRRQAHRALQSILTSRSK